MKRSYFLAIAITLASLGGGALLGACSGDGPGAKPELRTEPDSGLDSSDDDAGSDFDLGPLAPIGGLALWLDVAEPKALEKVAPGDDHIAQWSDKSKNKRHFKSSGAPAQAPSFQPNGMGNKPALFFDQKSRQYLVGPTLDGLKAAELFLVIKVRPGDGAQGQLPYGAWRFGDFTGLAYFPGDDGFIYEAFGQTVSHKVTKTSVDLSSNPRVYSVIAASGRWKAFIDGEQFVDDPASEIAFERQGSLLGGTASAGVSPTHFLAGWIGEVIVFDHELAANERTTVESYLSTKWNITLK